MDTSASAFDELDGSRMLHTLGALAIDLQDFITDLGKGKRKDNEDGKEGRQKRMTGEEGRRGKSEGKRKDSGGRNAENT